jgi:hypothetical protein
MMIQGFPVMGDDVPHAPEQGRGYEGRDLDAYPVGGLKCAKRGTSIQLIDPKEFPDRIAQKTKEKSWVRDICDEAGVIVKDQQNSNYCWIHAPVHGMECYYALSNGILKPLSAFKAGADIKGGRNQGGSGIVGVEYLSTKGTCTEELHRSMDFSTRITPEQAANSELHLITEWEDIDADNSQLMYQTAISLALSNIPYTVGIPSWSHEVLAGTFLVWDPSQFGWNFGGVGLGADNSWSVTYGNRGRFLLSRSYSRWDEMGAIRACTPANK